MMMMNHYKMIYSKNESPKLRNETGYAIPVTIGNNVWIRGCGNY
jgi:hypothetical protein